MLETAGKGLHREDILHAVPLACVMALKGLRPGAVDRDDSGSCIKQSGSADRDWPFKERDAAHSSPPLVQPHHDASGRAGPLFLFFPGSVRSA